MTTYSDFNLYPIEIIGLTADYNGELQAMEDIATELLSYSGDAEEVAVVVKYLVYILFWSARRSMVENNTGETKAVQEFSEPSSVQKNTVLYLAEKKLLSICQENNTTADISSLKLFYDFL